MAEESIFRCEKLFSDSLFISSLSICRKQIHGINYYFLFNLGIYNICVYANDCKRAFFRLGHSFPDHMYGLLRDSKEKTVLAGICFLKILNTYKQSNIKEAFPLSCLKLIHLSLTCKVCSFDDKSFLGYLNYIKCHHQSEVSVKAGTC